MEFQKSICGGGGFAKQQRDKKRQRKTKEVKVVYISSPMKVKTSASRFRSLVQQLTGRHSDIARIMETNGATDFSDDIFLGDYDDDHDRSPPPTSFFQVPMMASPAVDDESPTSSESQVDEQLDAIFPMDLFLNFTSFDMDEDDVLGSYDAL
ncbi:unnamed protein product [Cuscuta europaea]|uniref:VQ domain-containing protein n=1 Tax=Cuscuta europaea TaxID=41803 RepID=A0A9P1ECU0_CUSEU|nr:unnamed protein product [Cuscuta europaea]